MRTFTADELPYLFEGLKTAYGIDFLNYAQASFERRIERFLSMYPFSDIKDLTDKICADTNLFDTFVREITVNTTEMFRDPECWKIMREEVMPQLADLPTIRIWHAGCSSGEEIYTMAIILKECGLSEKCNIIASDINKEVMASAKRGRYGIKSLPLNEENYFKAGGTKNFSDYYVPDGREYVMDPELIKHVRFMKHDLSSGQNFSKFDIVICRNVLIYFNKDLQEKVFSLFHKSLFKKGFIVIGKKESMSYYTEFSNFLEFSQQERIYRLK